MMLAGALKYGGVYGFVPLCAAGEPRIVNAKTGGRWELAARTKGVTLEEKKADPGDLVTVIAAADYELCREKRAKTTLAG